MILYQEYAPHPALRAYLSCLWTCSLPRAAAATVTHRVLPDNGFDILWQNGREHGCAVGMMQGCIDAAIPALVQTLAVRFKPGAAAYFFDLPLSELTDRHASLEQLWGNACAGRIADGLWSQDLSERQRLDWLEQQLFRQLRKQLQARQPARAAALVAGAVAAIEGSGGLLRIGALAAALGVSRQHLAAAFGQRVGLTPKMFARVCRFQRTSQQAEAQAKAAQAIDWAGLALERGYFDQSHLIHEFQQFTGASPDAFAARR